MLPQYVEFFEELFQLVTANLSELDETFGSLLDRPAEQLDHVERALLRLATAEFAHRIDVPYRVVINEYVELAKKESNISFLGRLGTYRYLDMDVTIGEALAAAKKFMVESNKGETISTFFVTPV